MNVLITGGAGFIGSHIVDHYLLETNESVYIIDNLSSGTLENLEAWIGLDGSSKNPRAHFFEMDLGTADLADFMVRYRIDIIHHVAAKPRVKYSIDYPTETNQENITNTLRVLDAASKTGVRRVVYSASSSAYGDDGILQSPYALQKWVGEEYCRMYSLYKGLDTVSLRYFNVFGPRSTPESEYSAVIPIFADAMLRGDTIQIHGDGEQARDFTHVRNVVQANVLAAAENGLFKGQVFDVGCGQSISINDLYAQLMQTLGVTAATCVNVDSRPGDVRTTRSNPRRWLCHPVVHFEKGLQETADWYRVYFEEQK